MKRACKTAALLASCLFLLCGMQPAAFSAAGAGTGETYRKEVPSSSFADEYTSYAEDGNLELLVNEARCLLLLRDNATGAAYPLTPDDADGDAIASKAGIEEMKSHLNILYSGDDGVEKTMSSYADCVAKAQYRLFSLADGVRVEYTLGTPPDQRMILPLQMTVEAYADITGFYAQEEKTLKRLQYFYSLVSLSVVQNDAQRKELLAAYPVLEKQDIYVARTMSEKERKELEGYFQAAGFTLERVDKLYEELGFAEERGSKPYFIIPVDYTLGDGVFAVEIASQEIRRNEDYYLETMTLLQYFGARKEESGYIFIPDGSGSLVRFGEGTKHTKLYMTGKVYGDDVGVEQTTDTVCFRLPVFGVKGEDSALFANITKGAAGAQITAQAGGIVDAYYTAYATFTYHNKYVYVLSNGDVEQKNWPVFAAESNTDPLPGGIHPADGGPGGCGRHGRRLQPFPVRGGSGGYPRRRTAALSDHAGNDQRRGESSGHLL